MNRRRRRPGPVPTHLFRSRMRSSILEDRPNGKSPKFTRNAARERKRRRRCRRRISAEGGWGNKPLFCLIYLPPSCVRRSHPRQPLPHSGVSLHPQLKKGKRSPPAYTGTHYNARKRNWTRGATGGNISRRTELLVSCGP